jgi:hypothetical protein
MSAGIGCTRGPSLSGPLARERDSEREEEEEALLVFAFNDTGVQLSYTSKTPAPPPSKRSSRGPHVSIDRTPCVLVVLY